MNSSQFVNNKESVNEKIFERRFIETRNSSNVFYDHSVFTNQNTLSTSSINKNVDKSSIDKQQLYTKSIFENRMLNVDNNYKLAKVGSINFNSNNDKIQFDKDKLSEHINKYL